MLNSLVSLAYVLIGMDLAIMMESNNPIYLIFLVPMIIFLLVTAVFEEKGHINS